MAQQTAFITGVAGFIGAALARRLLTEGWQVAGVDSLNDYYNPTLKQQRLQRLKGDFGDAFIFNHANFADVAITQKAIQNTQPEAIIHLGAQAGVRYSLKNPLAYAESNLMGHMSLLEAARDQWQNGCLKHFIYASSSSVYGSNEKVPFEETDRVDAPQSLYAATKRSNELLTYSYAKQFGLPSTGVRFFTVYGPWGRPDMSPMLFADKIMRGEKLPVFNHGDLWRDFTYIDDVVEALVRLIPTTPNTEALKGVPADVYNIGNQNPVKLLDYIETMADVLGKKANLDLQPNLPTEVYKTYADTTKLKNAVGWQPQTDLRDGLQQFAEWFTPWYAQNHDLLSVPSAASVGEPAAGQTAKVADFPTPADADGFSNKRPC